MLVSIVHKGATRVLQNVSGSFLFWDPYDRDWIAVAMGACDAPTSAHLEKHIFVAEKGDYYEITDGLPLSQHFK